MNDPRDLSPQALSEALRAARAATLAAAMDLSDEQWLVPYSPWIQPTAWDLGHVGWFAEFWLLRGPHRLGRDGFQQASTAPLRFGPDEHYDSAAVLHPDRWRNPLLPREELQQRLDAQLADVERCLDAREGCADTRYFAHLTLFHELMHVEALAWTRAFCGYPAPCGVEMPTVGADERLEFGPTTAQIGRDGDDCFAFDNEQPRHEVRLDAFTIDRHPVRNDAFLRFVDDGGYERDELWPPAWRRDPGRRRLPARWRRAGDGSIEHRHYDRWLPLPLASPVVHVSAIEAEAYCRWAGRRLPTAPEWEHAAAHGMSWGNSVWEWTASTFAPYTCHFRPGPYVTYSTPWFHHQRELRGGAYTTHRLLHDHRYRNFFLPHRTDVFVGFRTAGG
ncbi:MAG TPA: ergothioneine biosynthesis protein EgtB [bacterium]|nr:ergothioneine biosynthesis protein EgtB [bacterium]